MKLLERKLAELGTRWRREIHDIVAGHGAEPISSVTAGQLLGGLRGTIGLVCDTSEVDAQRGLIIRGLPVSELTGRLPEEVFWLLLTGELPQPAELEELRSELHLRCRLPDHVVELLQTMHDSHPMVQLSVGLHALQRHSVFAAGYAATPRGELWRPALDDALTLAARIPQLAACIYRLRQGAGADSDGSAPPDLAGRFAMSLGLGLADEKAGQFAELMRLYMIVHSDHEGSNACALAANTVGSTLADPYLAVAAGMDALAGPIHGLASQVCLEFELELLQQFGGVPTTSQLESLLWERLKTGKVLPGYGHAVLRDLDPRFTALHEFGRMNFPDDELFLLTDLLYQVAPHVLRQHGKASNPWPNVDGISGAIVWHYGLQDPQFLTVLFGMSMAIGLVSQYVVNSLIGAPLMRPRSVSLARLRGLVS